jgi:hypothetical protein
MELWALAVGATTTTITTTTRAVTTTSRQTSTTLESGANGVGQVPWGVWASLIVVVFAAVIAPIVSYVLTTRRSEERRTVAERLALLAKEREEIRDARSASVTIAYTPPAPGSDKFGSLDLINDGPSSARDVTWRVEKNPGEPFVIPKAQAAGGDPHHIRELPGRSRVPVAWAVRTMGRSESLSILLTWKAAEGFHQARVTVIVPP